MPRTSPPLAPLISVQLTPYRTPPSPGWSGWGHADSVLRSHGPERSMRIGQCPLSPPPSPPHASPPLPLLHRQSATAAAPGRWQYATAAATGTADITTTVAAAGIAAADWDRSGCVASAQNGTLWPCARCIPKRSGAKWQLCWYMFSVSPNGSAPHVANGDTSYKPLCAVGQWLLAVTLSVRAVARRSQLARHLCLAPPITSLAMVGLTQLAATPHTSRCAR